MTAIAAILGLVGALVLCVAGIAAAALWAALEWVADAAYQALGGEL